MLHRCLICGQALTCPESELPVPPTCDPCDSEGHQRYLKYPAGKGMTVQYSATAAFEYVRRIDLDTWTLCVLHPRWRDTPLRGWYNHVGCELIATHIPNYDRKFFTLGWLTPTAPYSLEQLRWTLLL